MKNSDPKPRHMHFASIGQRLGSLATFAIFLYLVYLAVNGRFDTEITRFAAWLEYLFS